MKDLERRIKRLEDAVGLNSYVEDWDDCIKHGFPWGPGGERVPAEVLLQLFRGLLEMPEKELHEIQGKLEEDGYEVDAGWRERLRDFVEALEVSGVK